MAVQENIIDFSKICRLCLMEETVMSSIFNEQDKHSSSVPLPLRIMACVSVELNAIDGLPSQICTTCLCQVDGWYKFKDLCETADAVLRKCIKNEPVHMETITQIRSKAQEIRQFFASPHLVKVDGLDSALSQLDSPPKPVEIAVKNEDEIEMVPTVFTQKYVVYMNPDMYFKWLKTKYKLSNKIMLKELPKPKVESIKSFPCYEISFDSQIHQRKDKKYDEEIIMEVGDCQLVAINPKNKPHIVEEEKLENLNNDKSITDHDYVSKNKTFLQSKINSECENTKVEESLANYSSTKAYLEKSLNERGNTHEEIIENVLYNFRLDNDGNVDVVSIVEGVTETNFQRGFRYTCLFCSKIVLNKLVYDKHIRDTHLDYLVCKVCDKQLYSLRNFLIHTKTHLGVYTFTCPVCGKGLTRASIFKSHMMYHYYGKVQECQICEKKFRDVFALKRHVQLHDKKIEYVCELCGFGTHLKSNLKYHVRAHADEKLFMCELCGKQFTAPQSLHHHKKTHTPNFPCPHCKRTFRHEHKYKNHLKQNHSDLLKYHNNNDMNPNNEQEKNEENVGGRFKLYSLLTFGSKNSTELLESFEKNDKFDGKMRENENFELREIESVVDVIEGNERRIVEEETENFDDSFDEKILIDKRKIDSCGTDKDFSSDDDLTLSAKKKMILQEKNKINKVKIKKRIKKSDETIIYFRTIKIQSNMDDDDSFEVVETGIDTSPCKKNGDKKKLKSRKTQTLREQCPTKKRFRIRPAVPSSCTLCDKVYKNSEILRQHMKSHHVTGTIECPSCKLTFTSLRSLKYHEQRKHSNLEPVPCSFCGKKFLDKKYLRIHENIHSQTNHFVCQFCGRKFIMKTNLTVHISRHHTKKSNDFVCQICGKAFPFKLYLKKHFKTHTDYKPYQCTHCEAKFRENTLLRKHVNSIHLKLRPFLCQYCHKTFTRSLYLREHMESQHLGIQRKLECSKCGETFQNRNRLRQHECLGRMDIIRMD